jgi:hypothetical protein
MIVSARFRQPWQSQKCLSGKQKTTTSAQEEVRRESGKFGFGQKRRASLDNNRAGTR